MDIQRAPQPRRGRWVAAGALLLLLVIGWGAVSRLGPASTEVERATVTIDTVRRGNLTREVRAPGTLVPEHIRWISALIPARVDRIAAQPGQRVSAGTVLVEMSNPDVQIEALQAQQALSAARSRLAELTVSLEGARLVQEGVVATARTTFITASQERTVADTMMARALVSRVEYTARRAVADEASTRLQVEQRRLALFTGSVNTQLEAQRDQIRRLQAIADFQTARVASLVVRAGEDGVLQELPLQPGQWVVGGTTIGKVVQPGLLKAVLRVPETQAKDIVVGQTATIDTRNGVVSGRVARIDPAAQSGTVTVDVALTAPLPAGARPDLGIDGAIQLERLRNVLYMGRPSVGEAQGTAQLYRMDERGETATRRSVRLGGASANAVEIVAGLEPGDRVVLSGIPLDVTAPHIRLR